jgi:hypothetical protein
MNPSARGASSRCTCRCKGDRLASLQGVNSLNTSSGTRRRRAQASARIVAGPYSQLTTQSGLAALSVRATRRGRVTGLRPRRLRCQAGSSSLG